MKILIGILTISILTVSGWWVWSEIHQLKIDEKYLLNKKYCEQDDDCQGTCRWECVNKYNIPVEAPCIAQPACECINNECVQRRHEFTIKEKD